MGCILWYTALPGLMYYRGTSSNTLHSRLLYWRDPPFNNASFQYISPVYSKMHLFNIQCRSRAFFRGCTAATLPYVRWVRSVEKRGNRRLVSYLQRSDYVAHVHAHAVYYLKDKNLGPKVKILGMESCIFQYTGVVFKGCIFRYTDRTGILDGGI